MELTQLFEEELTQAVEVKDAKSLHRYVVLLTDRLVQRQDQEQANKGADSRFDAILSEIKTMRVESEKNFAVVNARFEASDKRFDDVQATLNKRFDSTQWIITFVTTFCFTLMGAMMTVFHFVK